MHTRNLTKYAILALYLNMFFYTISAISSYLQYDLLDGFSKGIYQQDVFSELAMSNDNREMIIGILSFIALIVCFIVVGRWIFVSGKITVMTGAENLNLSPGWAVGWYFIPIFSLWKPYESFKKIYQVSVDPQRWNNVVIPSMIKWWWALWIITNIIGQFQFRATMHSSFSSSIEAMQYISLSYVFSLPLHLLLFLVFIKILKGISERHNSETFQNILVSHHSLSAAPHSVAALSTE